MKITHEITGGLTLIYVYIRLFNGKKVKTLTGVSCELLYDAKENWIGINILDRYYDGEKLALPEIKLVMENKAYESINKSDKMITLLFNNTRIINRVQVESCNIDFNDDGFFGVELILDHEIGGMEVVNNLIK